MLPKTFRLANVVDVWKCRFEQNDEAMLQSGPPRGIGRTYSEDIELDTSAGSSSSSDLSPPPSSEGDPRLFLDMLQVRVLCTT